MGFLINKSKHSKIIIFIISIFCISRLNAEDLELKSKALFIYPNLTIELKLINNSSNNYYIFFNEWKVIKKSVLEEFPIFYPRNDCLVNYFYFFPSEDFGKKLGTKNDCSETYPTREFNYFPSYKKIKQKDSLLIRIEFKAFSINILTDDYQGQLFKYMNKNMMLESNLHYINQRDFEYFKKILNKSNQDIENAEVLINNYLSIYIDYDEYKHLTKFNSRVKIDPKYTDEIAVAFSNIVRAYCDIIYVERTD